MLCTITLVVFLFCYLYVKILVMKLLILSLLLNMFCLFLPWASFFLRSYANEIFTVLLCNCRMYVDEYYDCKFTCNLRGGCKWRLTSCRLDSYNGDLMTPTCLLNYILFIPNIATRVPTAK